MMDEKEAGTGMGAAKTMRWTMHNGTIMRYDPMDESVGVVRVTDGWPKPGEQHFYVRFFPDGKATTEETRYEHRNCLANAILLAEEWLA